MIWDKDSELIITHYIQISDIGKAASSERRRVSTDTAPYFSSSGILELVTIRLFHVLVLLINWFILNQEEIEELERENRLHSQQVMRIWIV